MFILPKLVCCSRPKDLLAAADVGSFPHPGLAGRLQHVRPVLGASTHVPTQTLRPLLGHELLQPLPSLSQLLHVY